jgi:hypothetical protein
MSAGAEGERPLSLRRLLRLGAEQEAKLLAVVTRLGGGRTRRGVRYLDLGLADASGAALARVYEDETDWDAAAGARPGLVLRAYARVEPLGRDRVLRLGRIGQVELSSDARRGWVYGEQCPDLVEASLGTVLAFDIETTPRGVAAELPASLRQRLERHARRELLRDGEPVDEHTLAERMRLEQSLNPLYGQLVSLALAGDEAAPSAVLLVGAPPETLPHLDAVRVLALEEPAALELFWQVARVAECVVSFNGEFFDLPFLTGRSQLLGVPAPRGLANHSDARELLVRGRGRNSSLELYCWALGFEGPKGVFDGGDVERLWREGRWQDLAAYNLGDARATLAVWRRLTAAAG